MRTPPCFNILVPALTAKIAVVVINDTVSARAPPGIYITITKDGVPMINRSRTAECKSLDPVDKHWL